VRAPPVASGRTGRRAPRGQCLALRGAAVAGLLSLVAGCAYVPPLGHQFNRGDLARLRQGFDTRAHVDSLLRDSYVFLSTPRWLGTEKARSGGTFIALAGPGGGVLPLTSQRYRLLFRFDRRQMLETFDLEAQYPERERVPGQSALFAETQPAESLAVRESWHSPSPSLTCVAVDPRGRIAAGAPDGRLWLWPEAQGGAPTPLEIHDHIGDRMEADRPDALRQVAFTDSGRALACLDRRGALAIVALPPAPWTPAARPGVAGPRWTRRGVSALDVGGGDACVVVTDRRRRLEVLDAATGTARTAFACPKRWTLGPVALSPDGCRLASVEFRAPSVRLRVRELCGAGPASEPNGIEYPLQPGVRVQGLRFSPDGRTLAIDGLTHVQCWESGGSGLARDDSLRLAHAFLRPYAHRDLVVEAGQEAEGTPARPPAFACDGGAIAIAADRLLVYDAADSLPTPWCVLRGSRSVGEVRDFAGIPGTRRVAVATNRGLFVWEVPPSP
jgi:hypothetical protein